MVTEKASLSMRDPAFRMRAHCATPFYTFPHYLHFAAVRQRISCFQNRDDELIHYMLVMLWLLQARTSAAYALARCPARVSLLLLRDRVVTWRGGCR
jgi:hypothetical protein